MQRDFYQNALQERILCELSQWTSEWDWKGAKVLDVGSRYGHRSEELGRQLAPLKIDGIRGVDTDIHGIEFATKHFADEKLEFSYIADFEDRLPLKYSQAFDWVLHINPTLFHLNNQEAALRNLLWCLKPSTGRLLLAIPCQLPADIATTTTKIILKKMGKQLNQWATEALDINKKPWYGHPRADRIYAHIMESVGFRVHRTKIMDFTYKFEKKNEHKGSVESYYFDVIMSFPEEQREALARRLHSSATGSGLRLGLRWDARYVLILASRPALTCNVCYGPRRTQQDEVAGECQNAGLNDLDAPPPIPLLGPPPDVEDDVGEIHVEVLHNDDLGNVDGSDAEEQCANDDEGVAQILKGNLFVDDINHYDRVADYDKAADDNKKGKDDDYIETSVYKGDKNDKLADRINHHTEEKDNIYNLNRTNETNETTLTDLNKADDVHGEGSSIEERKNEFG
ncbi:uncharacterized protein LOC111253332 isoform X3 [Varroa destructor]|uniref:Methyltransferase domain-containing protein n=1 Tax=Varroa destructor TaxID=109461 RepID=A0A7M7KNC1_VARDE|nr:uncharacterized protein LOC111253332 isoform X3 [Varroa destructor]